MEGIGLDERWLKFLTKPVGLVSGERVKPFGDSQVVVCGRAAMIKLHDPFGIQYMLRFF